MSYDLCARKDRTFSGVTFRAQTARFISAIPSVVPNGSRGFVVQRGDKLYMEIDLSTVSEEGDVIDDDNEPSPTINCINFHVPYAYSGELETCRAVAFQIAQNLRWELYDPQTDAVVREVGPTKPWWKHW